MNTTSIKLAINYLNYHETGSLQIKVNKEHHRNRNSWKIWQPFMTLIIYDISRGPLVSWKLIQGFMNLFQDN